MNSEDEKKELVNQTTLSLLQINNWFSNKRVRYKRKMQKEGQEVVEGGVDINQAFRSIKKQKDKKEASSTSSQSTPKRKRSTATKDLQYTKKKRPTPLKTDSVSNSSAVKIVDSSPTSLKTPTIASCTPTTVVSSTSISHSPIICQEPSKNVLSSLLESPSNMNMNGNSVVLLRSPIINSPTEQEKKTPDEKSTESPQPKQIDFFQSLQQAGVIFPQNTMSPPVIPVMPTYHPYVVHNAGAQFVDTIAIPYSYPIYTPGYYPNQVIFMNKQMDENNFFDMDNTFATEQGDIEQFEDNQQSDNMFHASDLFSNSGEKEDGVFDNHWNLSSTNDDNLLLF